MIWLCMWRRTGLGFALEDFDDDHVAAATWADEPRLFGRGVSWCRVVSVFGRALRHIQKLANGGDFFDTYATG